MYIDPKRMKVNRQMKSGPLRIANRSGHSPVDVARLEKLRQTLSDTLSEVHHSLMDMPAPAADDPPFRDIRRLADHVRAVIRARAARNRFFPDDLLADPGWDMLLDLFANDLDGRMISVTSLCIAAHVPMTTALRWVGNLEKAGMIERIPDPADRRRVTVRLTDKARQSLFDYFGSVDPERLGGL